MEDTIKEEVRKLLFDFSELSNPVKCNNCNHSNEYGEFNKVNMDDDFKCGSCEQSGAGFKNNFKIKESLIDNYVNSLEALIRK